MGEIIARSGLYEVWHAGRRQAHHVMLVAGNSFPRCARCGDDVRFQLLRATDDIRERGDRQVRLYEIPHPPDADEDVEVA